MARIRKNGKMVYTDELKFDPSPLYRVKRVGNEFDHSAAFDPMYECDCEKIDGRHKVAECKAPDA